MKPVIEPEQNMGKIDSDTSLVREALASYDPESQLVPHGVDTMLRELEKINLSQDYDDDNVKPTDRSIHIIRTLLDELEKTQTKTYFIAGDVYPDGSGGIRIEWQVDNRYVRVVAPGGSDLQPYLYIRQDKTSELQYNPTAVQLGEILDWLKHDDLSAA